MKALGRTLALLVLLVGLSASAQTMVQHTGTMKSARVGQPTVTTTPATGISGTSVATGGTITATGLTTITASGVCWSTATYPTTANSKTAENVTSGGFTSILTGLTAGTAYYVRAYATNSAGTAYGSQITFTAQATTTTLAYTGGAQTYTVPGGVTQLQVECWGAQGGDVGTTLGGRGGYAKALVAVTPGETAYAYLGQQGSLSAATTNTAGVPTFNGGGAGAIRAALGTTASGGGASDVRLGGSELANRIVVAGGGGGCDDYNSSAGGAGGGSTGASGATVASSTAVGTGGTQSAGGTGGAGGSGALGLGGSATQDLFVTLDTRLSGGGGGYYGGGLGSNSGGGGGSGYTGGVSPYTTSSTTMSSGIRAGNGQVRITITALLPAVTTTAVTGLTLTTATTGGTFSSVGVSPVTASGVCWATTANPTIANSKTAENATSGTFISSLTGLTASTTYYVRAYATNLAGTAYGPEVTFTTLNLPTVTTTAISNVASTSASSGGTLGSNGGTTILANGVCWSTTTGPTVALSTKTTDTVGATWTSNITGLTSATTYYVRAYATNSMGTAYGAEVSFLASNTITTSFSSTGAMQTYTVPAYVTSVDLDLYGAMGGGGTGSTAGYGGHATGTLAVTPGNLLFVAVGGQGGNLTNGTFNGGYLSTGAGWNGGGVPACGSYPAATGSIGGGGGGSDIRYGGNTLWDRVIVAGGGGGGAGNLNAIGIAGGYGSGWTNPGRAGGGGGLTGQTASGSNNGVAAPGGTQSAGGSVNGTQQYLTDGTFGAGGYYVGNVGTTFEAGGGGGWYGGGAGDWSGGGGGSGYIGGVTNGIMGTNVYGGGGWVRVSYTVTVPTVTTTAMSSIAATSANSGGTLTFGGNAQVTANGICWSTTSGPTVDLSTKTTNTVGTTWTSSMTGLTAGTTYYVRAYATNRIGTGYGAEVSFTTPTTPTLSATTAASAITGTTATSGGTVSATGGSTITALGVCYATTTAPTIASSRAAAASLVQTGAFTSSLTGLTASTTYYLRAYATNAVGTSYGPEVSFATMAAPTLTATAAASALGSTMATSGGTVSTNGGGTITAQGVCFATTTAPTIAKSLAPVGTIVQSGSFTCSITGLAASTTYYSRAYSTNSAGTSYGPEVSFTTTAAGIYGSNWLRGAPTTDPANRRAVVASISAINGAANYTSSLETWTGNWQAPQAIYEHGSNLDDPTTWYQTSANEGSTWSNPTLGTSAGELVVDMQTTRTLARFVVFQMFSDGKTTHAYFYSHPSTSATAPANTDAGWVLVGGGAIGVGATSGSVVTSPTTFTMTPFTSRYIKLRAQNDGTQLNPSYIELKGVKAFSQ